MKSSGNWLHNSINVLDTTTMHFKMAKEVNFMYVYFTMIIILKNHSSNYVKRSRKKRIKTSCSPIASRQGNRGAAFLAGPWLFLHTQIQKQTYQTCRQWAGWSGNIAFPLIL